MNSLMTEIWRCVNIAEDKGEEIRIHIHPATLSEIRKRHADLFKIEKGLMGYGLFGCPVIADESIVEDNFWIEVTK